MNERQPLFPPWSDAALRLGLAAALGGAIAGPLLAMVWARSAYTTGRADPVRQPIAFDHRHHVRDVEIDCRFCHAGAETSRNAGVPPTKLCMGCHAQIWNDAPVLAPLRESVAKNEPIRWVRVNTLPDHVFFDHSIHVARGVGCETCHGRVDQMAQVQATESLSMSFCLDCHRDPASRKVVGPPGPTHCTACHR
ncbi:MAG: cytochrome c3 family protein [Polyangiales bacterium]